MGKRTLVAFSGGLDTTLLLWKLARNTDEELHCFQMDLTKCIENGHYPYKDLHAAEKKSGKVIVDWISKNVRKVTHEVIKVNFLHEGEWLTPTSLRVGAKLMDDFDRMVTGRTWENTTKKTSSIKHQELWKSLVPNKPLEWPLMDWDEGRAHALFYLPQELKDFTTPCQMTKVVNRKIVLCGECPKCVRTNEAKDMLDSGILPEVVYDYQLKKKGAGPYSAESPIFDQNYYKPPSYRYKLHSWD